MRALKYAPRKNLAPAGYDFITTFDCLHDMGAPGKAARKALQALKPDGTWMIVEPLAGDRLEDNFTPVGRLYYSASVLLCVPGALAQENGICAGRPGRRAPPARNYHAGRVQPLQTGLRRPR